MSDSQQHDSEYSVHPHITPTRTYAGILGALMVLTVLTVAVSYVPLGQWSLIVAILIATMKAALVVMYFMHMKYETKFNIIVFLGSVVFLGIFMAYTLNDMQYRTKTDVHSGARIDPATGKFAYGTPEALKQTYKKKQQDSEQGASGGEAMAQAGDAAGAGAGAGDGEAAAGSGAAKTDGSGQAGSEATDTGTDASGRDEGSEADPAADGASGEAAESEQPAKPKQGEGETGGAKDSAGSKQAAATKQAGATP
jgi:cytochrome c oxidase subunit 4